MFRRLFIVLAAVFFAVSSAWADRFFPSSDAAYAVINGEGWHSYSGAAVLNVGSMVYGGAVLYTPDWSSMETFRWPVYGSACPAGTQVESSTGECVAPPPTQEERDAICAAKSGTSAGHYTMKGADLVIAINGGSGGSTHRAAVDGCVVASVGPASCTWSPGTDDVFCTADWTYTGGAVPVGGGEGEDTTITDQPAPSDATTDSRTSSTTETYPAPGETVTTKTTDKGTTVENRPDGSTVITKPNGDTDVTRKTVVVSTNPDGLTEETTVVQRTVTVGGKTTTIFSGGSGVPISISGPSTTAPTSSSGTTTTTTTRDAQGGVTGTTTTTEGGNGQGADGAGSSGSGSGSGDGQGEEPVPDGAANAGRAVLPGLEDAPSFGDSVGAFRDAVAASPIAQVGQSLTGLSDSGGTCSAPSFQLFGQSFTLDFHCQVWPDIAPVLESVALAAWAILAVLVLLSA